MSSEDVYADALQMLLEYQGLHKMRNTPERRLILQQISAHPGRFTPADVVAWVKVHFISQATVYNTLRVLENAHIIHPLHRQHAGRLMEYELSLGEQNSMSIICSKCGRISRISDKSTEVALHMKKYPNFIMRHYSVYVFGECKHCVKLTYQKAQEAAIKAKNKEKE